MSEAEKKIETPATTPAEAATTTPVTPSPTTSEEPSALASLGLKEGEEAPVVPAEKVETPPAEAPKATEAYELELAENSPLSEKDLDEVVALAEKYKWPKEVAEQYLKNREEAYSRGEGSIRQKALDMIRAEKETFLKDPDFQGEKLVESMRTIDTVVKKYGDPALVKFLKGPGGNNLALAKTLLKIGNTIKQDEIEMGGGKGKLGADAPENTREASLKSMYPSFFPEA